MFEIDERNIYVNQETQLKQLTLYQTLDAGMVADLEVLEKERPDIDLVELQIKDPSVLDSFPKLERLRVCVKDLKPPISNQVIEKLGDALISVDLSDDYGNEHIAMTGEHFSALSKHSNLQLFRAGGCESIVDDDLRHLSPHKDLTSISLKIGVKGPGLRHLTSKLKMLDWMTTPTEPLRKEHTENLDHLAHLTSLVLVCRHCEDDAFEPLGALPSVDSLYLSSWAEQAELYAPLGNLSSLRAFHLGAPVQDKALAFLGKLESLERLTLRVSKRIKALPELAQMSSLVSLDLKDTKISDKAFLCIGKLPDVRMLYTSAGTVTDKGVAALKGHKKLTMLTLSGKKITDASIDVLESLPNLRFLRLLRVSMTAEGLERLAKLPLVHFGLSGVPLGEDLIPVLTKFTKPRFVHVEKCKIAKKAQKKLASSFGEGQDFYGYIGTETFGAELLQNEDGAWVVRYFDRYEIKPNGVRENISKTIPA